MASELLVTRPGGYMFNDAAAQLDYRRYKELSTTGQSVLRSGGTAEGISLLSRSLGIWRGAAFVDVMTGPALGSLRHQLEESRLGTVEALSDVRIGTGRHDEAIFDLAPAVSNNPLHEGLHYQYMRALAVTGRRAKALEVFNLLRLNLVSELGIEPGAPIQQLQYQILNSSDIGHMAAYSPSTGGMAPVV
ncbi:hypothetical protein BIV23_31525 [Streptomyces monashensis]|uniref:Bacterial transcriptional activator domain-containing protein n=1 Tax=Streptomyces monashensis TaxID=1678012 RepID=A0A1S2PT91_9ACTN|nr:hypothetical protein BIV23_31525 [Streptomyces monashensis]